MKRFMLGTLGLSLWALAALACASAPPGGGGSEAPPGSAPNASAADSACQADADCVIVETACCDHCNGGKAEAFNKAHADKFRPKGCEKVACTLIGCGEAVAVCANNVCRTEIKQILPP